MTNQPVMVGSELPATIATANRRPARTNSSFGLRHSSFFPDLSISQNNVLVAGQLAQAAGAAGVEFVGADPDLGPQAQLSAVVEPRAGVDHDGGRIDAGDKSLSGGQVARHDRVGVMRPVRFNVLDRLL